MNDITPKEANEILSHYTDIGYGIVIEGEDISKIKQALSLASKTLANGTPYNPTGDCISREVINSEIEKRYCSKHCVVPSEEPYCPDNCPARFLKNIVKECPSVPQVTVFAENADEKAVADMKAELQNVVEARPNEQTAWEQGYEVGLAQGKYDRPQGEWIEYNATGKKQYMCSKCSMEEKNPKMARYCYWCGAKMRKKEENDNERNN